MEDKIEETKIEHVKNLNRALELGSYEENKEEWDALEEALSLSSVQLIVADSKESLEDSKNEQKGV